MNNFFKFYILLDAEKFTFAEYHKNIWNYFTQIPSHLPQYIIAAVVEKAYNVDPPIWLKPEINPTKASDSLSLLLKTYIDKNTPAALNR